MDELERLKIEKLLLEKQDKVIKKQAMELREDFQEMKAKYIAFEGSSKIKTVMSEEQFTIPDFIDGKNGPSPVLREAVTYCETHDGCPFFRIGCDPALSSACQGVWIRMGVPCTTFAKEINSFMKSVNGLQK